MSTPSTITSTINTAMLANIDVLHFRLTQARFRAADALAAMRIENRNLAIGMLLDFDQLLPEIDALYHVIRLLHRSRDISISSEEVQS